MYITCVAGAVPDPDAGHVNRMFMELPSPMFGMHVLVEHYSEQKRHKRRVRSMTIISILHVPKLSLP